jgi:hypothetical protein
MGSRSSSRKILILAVLALATALLLSRRDARESTSGELAVSPGAGWQQAFRDLAVGP